MNSVKGHVWCHLFMYSSVPHSGSQPLFFTTLKTENKASCFPHLSAFSTRTKFRKEKNGNGFEICEKPGLNFVISLWFWCGFLNITCYIWMECMYLKNHIELSVLIVTLASCLFWIKLRKRGLFINMKGEYGKTEGNSVFTNYSRYFLLVFNNS